MSNAHCIRKVKAHPESLPCPSLLCTHVQQSNPHRHTLATDWLKRNAWSLDGALPGALGNVCSDSGLCGSLASWGQFLISCCYHSFLTRV